MEQLDYNLLFRWFTVKPGATGRRSAPTRAMTPKTSPSPSAP
jgi:hypothetical protein